MDYQLIIAGTVGKQNTHGTLDGRVKAGPMSFARFSTDDFTGQIKGYVGQGASPTTRSALWRRGRRPDPQHAGTPRYICENGFEHHVAASFSTSAPIHEAATKVLKLATHWHK